MSGGRARAVVALLVVGLALAYGAAAWTRHAAVPDAVRWLPREHDLLLATGDLASLWSGVDRHFGDAIREGEREGALAQLAAAVREVLAEGNLELTEIGDLSGYGLDVSRGVLAALSWSDGGTTDGVLVLPVGDASRFREAFGALRSDSPREVDLTSSTGRHYDTLTWDDEVWLSFPEPGTAVVAGSRRQLERSLLHPEANLRWARNNTSLARALARLHGGGARLVARWQRPADPLIEASALVALGPREARVEAVVRLERGLLRVVDDLLSRRAATPGPEARLGEGSAAVLTIEDPALTRYLRAAGRFEPLGELFERAYGGLLARLRDSAGLERLTLAVTGYRDGLPELLLGLEGHTAALEEIVTRAQAELAAERDRTVLERAVAAWADAGRPVESATVAALEEAGFLAAEPALAAAALAGGKVEPAQADASRFEGPDYGRTIGAIAVRYLAPRRTENDWRYAPGQAELDREVFFDDRYRIAAGRRGEVLWIATDARDIEQLSSPGQADSAGLVRRPSWNAATGEWTQEHKLRLFADLDRLVELGLLTPEPEVESAVRRFLLDLRGHPGVAVALRPAGSRSLELTLRLPTRSALETP